MFRSFVWLLVWLILVLDTCTSCKKSFPVPSTPNNISSAPYEDRLMLSYLDHGMVVSRDSRTTASDTVGDSLLFTGIAMGALPCDKAVVLFEALKKMQDDNAGYLVRFNPLPSSFLGNSISRDGAVGAWWGLLNFQKNCPSYSVDAQFVINRWVSAVKGRSLLAPNSTAILIPAFYSFWTAAQGTPLSTFEYGDYVTSMFVTTKMIQIDKSACYPVHIQTLENLVLELEGQPILKADKTAWCQMTQDFGLLLTDWYCQRNWDKIVQWLEHADNSGSIYMHERCTWESSDASDVSSPRVDFLILNHLINH